MLLKVKKRINFLEIFERINGVEDILKQDPSNTYPNMDYRTKEYYRNRIKEISKKTKISELYMQLICRYYEDMKIDFTDNREKLLNIIDEDYKKLILTNAKIKVYKSVITEKEVEQIIKENKISENIDDVIWFLYNKIVMNF